MNHAPLISTFLVQLMSLFPNHLKQSGNKVTFIMHYGPLDFSITHHFLFTDVSTMYCTWKNSTYQIHYFWPQMIRIYYQQDSVLFLLYIRNVTVFLDAFTC